jgi:glycosyltransferase involved in cell wall biosynthesis
LLLKEADVVLLINEPSRTLYQDAYPEVDVGGARFHILPNGVDIEPFRRRWEAPFDFGDRHVVVHVGASPVNWDLIFECADRTPDAGFCIVTPVAPDRRTFQRIRSRQNLRYVAGVAPAEVPRYVTNADAVMIPNPAHTSLRVARLHGQVLQAMAAGKPIVVYYGHPSLQEYGIRVATCVEEFVQELREAIAAGPASYPVDLEPLSWSRIQQQFLSLVGL